MKSKSIFLLKVLREITVKEYDGDDDEETSIKLNQNIIGVSSNLMDGEAEKRPMKTNTTNKQNVNLLDMDNIFSSNISSEKPNNNPIDMISGTGTQSNQGQTTDLNDIFSSINLTGAPTNPVNNDFPNFTDVGTTITNNPVNTEQQQAPIKQDTMDLFGQISNVSIMIIFFQIYGGGSNEAQTQSQPQQNNNIIDFSSGINLGNNMNNAPNPMSNQMNMNNQMNTNDLLGSINLTSNTTVPLSNQNTAPNNSLGFDALGFGTTPSTNNQMNQPPSPNMKNIFCNEEITIYCSSNKAENNTTNATLNISNNVDKQLTNVKINLFVIKYVSYKVLSTSGNILEPRQSFGIKKVN